MVRCVFEDREGNLWVGANSGLNRLRDDVFTVYGKSEGLPSDEPNAVFQDRGGRIWVGFHEGGLLLFSGERPRLFTTRDGLPDNDVFSIRESRTGDLLIGTRGGLARMHGEHFDNYTPPDPLGRRNVFDALEDSRGRLWLAKPGGLSELRGKEVRQVVQGEPLLVNAVVTLCEGRDGALWAGTYGKGLWRIQGEDARLFTMADGLSNNQIRSLYQDPDGTLWIGTFGGGLDALRDGRFQAFTAKDGLLSDNIASLTDDGESLWLSTTRGICRIAKRQLREFAEHKRKILEPANYGVEDGLRSAQCSPSYPIGGGGNRTSDGRLWFTTARGLAVLDPRGLKQAGPAPVVHLVEMTADGLPVDLGRAARLAPGSQRIQIRYTAIHLSAPERVQYSYKLEGLDAEWVWAGGRRRDQLQQPAARPLPVYRESQSARRAGQRRSRTPSNCCRSSTRRHGSACCARRWCWPARGPCSGCVCGRSATGSRWCWMSGPGWRARFTTRWRRDSWAFLRSSTR